jgi:hypothetical protein
VTIKALVLFAHQKGHVIMYGDGCLPVLGTTRPLTEREKEDGAVEDFIHDMVGPDDFDLEKAGADYAPHADGVYVGTLKLVDDGPGDWPGSREVALQLCDTHLATEEEWRAYRDGEWPWEAST